MRPFSLFTLPEKKKHIFTENFKSSSIDFKRFSFSNKNEFLELIWDYFPGYNLLDRDNSNSRFFRDAVFVRVPSNLWLAFQYVVSIVWVWTVQLVRVEIYKQSLSWCVGRIDFPWAFFHFREYTTDRINQLYDFCENKYLLESSWIRCTRVDVALDFHTPFPKSPFSFLKPAKRDKVKARKTIKAYNPIQWNFQSVSYLPKKNTWYGVRMYNKSLDIKDKWKEFWYWDYPSNWTRIEFEFYPPYSNINTSDSIISLCNKWVFWHDIVSMGLTYRPPLWFNVENAYDYFLRYAKNKWISIKELLEELQNHLTFLEESIKF